MGAQNIFDGDDGNLEVGMGKFFDSIVFKILDSQNTLSDLILHLKFKKHRSTIYHLKTYKIY